MIADMFVSNIMECILEQMGRECNASPLFTGINTEAPIVIDEDYTYVIVGDNVQGII